jgi:hypothetical protein
MTLFTVWATRKLTETGVFSSASMTLFQNDLSR